MPDTFLDIGAKVSIQKLELDGLFAKLRNMGYEVVGPKAKDHTIVHAPLKKAADLPIGYTSTQDAGKYNLIQNGHQNYFDVTTGPHSWKQYFFPPKTEMMRFHQDNGGWRMEETVGETPHYAMIGVRPCDLAAIEIQDKVFMRDEWCDPIYRSRRENAFLVAVNCTEPCGTCFCASMGTGPDAKNGFDLCLTELDNSFLVEVGSEAGRMALGDETITWSPASAFMLNTVQKELDAARQKMGRQLPNPENLKTELLSDLNNRKWEVMDKRCLSCSSCTQVCPTCFCWDTTDETSLPADTSRRVRQWDSCFNPDYSYVAHGNTRPSTCSRYRQWLTHKFASWQHQFGVSGCVGCGRCITWCPAEIDHVAEIANLRQEGRS